MDLLAKKLSVKERKAILTQLIELKVLKGEYIEDLVGIQLSKFDFEKIQKEIWKIKNSIA